MSSATGKSVTLEQIAYRYTQGDLMDRRTIIRDSSSIATWTKAYTGHAMRVALVAEGILHLRTPPIARRRSTMRTAASRPRSAARSSSDRVARRATATSRCPAS